MASKGKLRILEGNRVAFWCPGCKEHHQIPILPASNAWGFNGNYDKPTFSPSVLVTSGHYVPGYNSDKCWCTWNKEHPAQPAPCKCYRCHSFVRDGKIQYLSDCTHELAGQTVDMREEEGD